MASLGKQALLVLPVDGDARLVERDAGVAVVDRPELWVGMGTDRGGDAGDLEPGGLSGGDATAVLLQRCGEERLNEPRLQLAGPGPLHEVTDLVVGREITHAADECPLTQDVLAGGRSRRR